MSRFRREAPVVAVAVLLAGFLSFSGIAKADTSHARIVRISLLQGDARFARDVKGDPLGDSQTNWETAVLNLPIRQGYALATDNGRAEIEFENGAMAFLAENSVLQFYDLSSEDGGLTTRLILRQGSAEFSVNPERGDYFSVTGGDFSVQAEGKSWFRMNNFDDGSNVMVLHGKLSVLTNGKNTELSKGQQLSMRAGDAESVEVGRAASDDEFDQWVSSRITASVTATNAAMAYSNNNYGYTSGFGDLYTYGSWFPVAGYGYCWRPYGVGLGWAPFDYGSWYYDPFFGWAFLGGYSWGWLPYHYGGWLFQPGVGWAWSPAGAAFGTGRWKPVTGVWMRNATGVVGIVPSHPLDTRGKTPLNLAQGLFAVTPRGVTGQIAADNTERLKTESRPGREIMQNQLPDVTAPARVSRAMTASSSAGAFRDNVQGSSIVYDQNEHRFVNSNRMTSEVSASAAAGANGAVVQKGVKVSPESAVENAETRVPPASERAAGREVPARQFVPAARNVPAPPSVPRAVANERAFNDGGAAMVGARGATGNSGGGRVSGAGSGSGTSAASSGGAGRGGSSGGSSGGSGSSGGGGRPH